MTDDEDLATLARVATRGQEITIGVLSDDVGNGYSAPIIGEFWRLARRHGIRLIQFVERLEPEDIGAGRRLVTNLASERCLDAVLVSTLGPRLNARDIARYCERLRPLPMCCIPDVDADWCPQVGVDNAVGMREAVHHLVEHHGYTRFAFLQGPPNNPSAQVRFAVFAEVLDAHGIELDPRSVLPGEYLASDGVEAVAQLADREPLPRAIVCANDAMAFGVIQALTARGVRVPSDVAVVGYDDIDLCAHMDPPLTTVRQPLRKLGRTALEVILKQLAGVETVERITLPSELAQRESCGCVFAAPGDSTSPQDKKSTADAVDVIAIEKTLEALHSLRIDWPAQPGPEDSLLGAFVDEVTRGAPGFLGHVQQTLASLGRAHRDVAPLQRVITVLWEQSRTALLPDSRPWRRADGLLHGARLLVASVAERTQSIQQVRSEDFANKLSATHGALSLTVNVGAVEDVLATELPKYDIPSCYVCAYGDDSTESLLLAGVRAEQRYAPPNAGGKRFSAKNVLPEGLLSDTELAECIVGPLSRTAESPGYAVFAKGPEDGFVYENLLAQLGATLSRLDLLNRLIEEARRREAAERERLEKELSIATRIQTGVLPRRVSVSGLEIAAKMIPASEVGGDYYDVIPSVGGCWLGIGDVAGHGLPAGVVMLMLQSVLGGLCRAQPTSSPRELLHHANQLLFDNVRQRMGQDEHVTLLLMRYESSGHVVFAGAHEDILVYRAASSSVQSVPTVGTWLAAAPDIQGVTDNHELSLEMGDVVLLYTDGVTEARNASGECFGVERLAEEFAANGRRPVETICQALVSRVERFSAARRDDVTLLAARHVGGGV